VARCMCETLQAAGIEVWFDQSELRGGDQWDAKIKKQIRDCVLFMPVISAATQARAEGYFRREWKLAVERTQDMADHVAFLLPVVLDDTKDRDAHVPEAFFKVQWTRLPGGEMPSAFVERVRALLGGGAGVGRDEGVASPARRATHGTVGRHRVSAAAWGVTAVATALLATGYFWSQRTAGPAPSLPLQATAGTRPPITEKSAPLSPARVLIAKARVLYEPWDLAAQDDFKQAEEFLSRALALDPSDGEAWTAQAMVSVGHVVSGLDTTTARRNDARKQADRAVKLAPASDHALFAQAFAMRVDPSTLPEAIRLLRELVGRNPRDKFMLRVLGAALGRAAETEEEGIEFVRRAAALPGGDPIAEYIYSWVIVARHPERAGEAIAALDRSLALAPSFGTAHAYKIGLLLGLLGDPPAARDALANAPPAVSREDRVAAVVVKVWFALDQPEQVLRALGPTSAYLATNAFNGPTAYLKGLAHRRAGRVPAAQTEWRVALRAVQLRLEAEPTATRELLWKARLLALLGERTEAETAFKLYLQFAGSSRGGSALLDEMDVRVLLGQREDVLQDLSRWVASRSPNTWRMAALVLFSPELDPLGDDPAFPALAEKARAYYAELRAGAPEKK